MKWEEAEAQLVSSKSLGSLKGDRIASRRLDLYPLITVSDPPNLKAVKLH